MTFKTNGSHGKAYFPWKFRDVELVQAGLTEEQREKVTESFSKRISCTYYDRFGKQKRLQVASDGFAGIPDENFHFSADVIEALWD